ncbi:hypothetical protein L5849_08360 [Erythrobacter sp. SN021]|uniref:hypothetical protein n=1 Tax=Erythrobacter sp. SN021 TaxID=2912574 RepID=UPI001F47E459|nr:hypothetical protein [Erythrobacter sp. SN021]MCF8882709.1 hypothetical protein [Erythrobacter sp. SN021]
MKAKPLLVALALGACATGPNAPSLAQEQAPSSERSAEITRAIEEMSVFAGDTLLAEDGSGRADYSVIDSEWITYETHWHTGQLIWGLLEAGLVLDRPDLVDKARRGGDWWVSTEFTGDHPLAGLVWAAHGDHLGDLINWTTISDGTPGLFALSRATGDARYADSAARSGQWLWDNTRVPDEIPGGEWLFYNIIEPETGLVYRDWDVHTQGVPRDPERAARETPPINRMARPNIEGFLFEDMCRHTAEEVWCERFLAQADSVLERQHESGLWLQFEPNNEDGSQIHPRFNVWNAEALLQAYEISGDRKYLEGAARTARWAQSVMRDDGTLYYRTSIDGESNRAEVTGSSVAFNGLLMLRLKDYGYSEFDETIDTLADWIIRNRFASDHPDPNLAGAVINTRQKQRDGGLELLNRDVGTTFALRFLSLYLRDLRGEDVNAYLNGRTP